MRKGKAHYYIFAAAGTLFLCGCIRLLVDWLQYSSVQNSAPFSVWVLVIGITYGGTALLCVIIGLLLWRKEKMRKDTNP